MLEKVRLALRINGEEFDTELADMIDEAKAEMRRLAISEDGMEKPLARRAIITYCRAHFDYGTDESFKLLNSFRLMVDEMRESAEYTNDDAEDDAGGDAG